MKVEILNNGYFLLTGKELEKEIAEQILKEYYLNIDTDVYKHSALVHLAVLDNVKERKFEFAFMISNYIIAKRNGGMMIPYLGIHKTYYQTIKDRNLKKLMYIFANIENKPRYELHDKILTREEVINKILAEKQILKEKYNVKKLYLYGSYAKNMINEKSDIDLLIVFEKEYINIENEIKKEEVKSFLKERLERVVDIIIFETALTNLEINEMEKIITII